MNWISENRPLKEFRDFVKKDRSCISHVIKILADQNFNGKIFRGLQARVPELDAVRTQDIGLEESTDYDLLDWAAENDRVTLTHDERTFHIFAYEKMMKGEKMNGVIVVSDQIPIGRAIDDLMIALTCKFDNEWANNITRIPI
jgi:predicted nuclease of predicted toxin-antitoxin system